MRVERERKRGRGVKSKRDEMRNGVGKKEGVRNEAGERRKRG